jgi:hypothetical protein
VISMAKVDRSASFLASRRAQTVHVHARVLIVWYRPRFVELGVGHRFRVGWLRRRFGYRVPATPF